jgi:hypothetical protein
VFGSPCNGICLERTCQAVTDIRGSITPDLTPEYNLIYVVLILSVIILCTFVAIRIQLYRKSSQVGHLGVP